MFRRSAVVLVVLASVAVVPQLATARPIPLPTAGSASVAICATSACGTQPNAVVGWFGLEGAISLDGGSFCCGARVDFVAQEVGCAPEPLRSLIGGCRLKFSGAPVSKLGSLLGGQIGGSCNGSTLSGAVNLARLKCSFTTPAGLSGTRQIVVGFVSDVTRVSDGDCDNLCYDPDWSEYVGAYVGTVL